MILENEKNGHSYLENSEKIKKWYFVILLGCFPLSGKITETMRAIFPCYQDQKK